MNRMVWQPPCIIRLDMHVYVCMRCRGNCTWGSAYGPLHGRVSRLELTGCSRSSAYLYTIYIDRSNVHTLMQRAAAAMAAAVTGKSGVQGRQLATLQHKAIEPMGARGSLLRPLGLWHQWQ